MRHSHALLTCSLTCFFYHALTYNGSTESAWEGGDALKAAGVVRLGRVGEDEAIHANRVRVDVDEEVQC